jgi:hypothetical protein
MHQTTVRFSPELWRMLESAADDSGVSVAHYIRDSALARLAYAAGQRSASEPADFAWADPRIAGTIGPRPEDTADSEASRAVPAPTSLTTGRAPALRAPAATPRRAAQR